MFYYQILPERKLPMEYLTYSSKIALKRGQVVKILIKNSVSFGLILAEVSAVQIYQFKNIKEIAEILPLVLSDNQINFLFALAYNTFNWPHEVLASMLSPIKKLGKQFWQNLQLNDSNLATKLQQPVGIDEKTITNQPAKPEILLVEDESQMLFRIRYIIRSYIQIHQNQTPTYPLVFLFPEKKYLLTTKKKLAAFLKDLSVSIDVFDASQNAQTKQTIARVLKQTAQQVIFGTRQTLFLPWQTTKLDLILIDESNSFYIQDENRLYYDTRDACFIFAHFFQVKLTFLSTLPSVRLFNFGLQTFLDNLLNTTSKNSQKPLKIKLLNRVFPRDSFFDLIDFLETTVITDDNANLTNDQNNDTNPKH